MSRPQNISFKKILRLIGGAALVCIFFVVLVAAAYHQNKKPINEIQVQLLNENDHSFIQKTDIIAMIEKDSVNNPHIKTLGNLDLNFIEKNVKANPWVMEAEVYIDNNQKLNVDIVQRTPIARLFHTNGSSTYLDTSLQTLPLSNNYAYQAPVFTGVPYLGNDSISIDLKKKIAFMSRIICADSFWSAQITQIDLLGDHTFALIPLLGTQRIIFGDTAFAEDKLSNLFAFYQEVSTKIGWDKYDTLDLRFRGQIVARPSLDYVPPVIKDSTTLKSSPVKQNQPIKKQRAP